jgi:hypothetical protein
VLGRSQDALTGAWRGVVRLGFRRASELDLLEPDIGDVGGPSAWLRIVTPTTATPAVTQFIESYSGGTVDLTAAR